MMMLKKACFVLLSIVIPYTLSYPSCLGKLAQARKKSNADIRFGMDTIDALELYKNI